MQLKTQLDMQYTETVKRLIQRQITNILTLNLSMIRILLHRIHLDHHSDEGNQSPNIFSSTHPEIAKVKGLKAESGANEVTLSWKPQK